MPQQSKSFVSGTYNYSFIIKEAQRMWAGRAPDAGLPSPRGIRSITLTASCVLTSQKNGLSWCPEFFLEFCYIAVIDWITGHGFELHLQPPSLSGGQSDEATLQITHLIFLVTSPHPEATRGHCFISTTKMFLSLRKFQGCWSSVPGAEHQMCSLLYHHDKDPPAKLNRKRCRNNKGSSDNH